MSRFFPRSLFGQTLLVLLGGLIISQAAGWWIYTMDREQAVRAIGGLAAAQRVANLARLVHEAPREWRERIVSASSDPSFRVALASRRPALSDDAGDSIAAEVIREFLAEQLTFGSGQQPLVSVSTSASPPFAGLHPMGRGPMMHGLGGFAGFGLFRDLQVAVPLSDGQWLTFATNLPDSGPAFSRQFLASMAIMAIIILGVSIWAVRRVTAPLASLAAAAEQLGRDVTASQLPESGTIETRQASRAFNDMQTRLRSLIENRMRMLAAISHDLRTPLTLLRLRAENVEDTQERSKMLATIGEMDAMLGSTLQFARDETVNEPRRPTDLAALLQSIVDDMSDAGIPVATEPAEPIVYECRPIALKRAVTNLIDNAVKYGKSVRATLKVTPKTIEIVVDDEGPGIPLPELSHVLEPFYRVENSRSRETGVVGLGLAIAQSIVQSHGGELALSNRPTGGLRASIRLPR
jgi:signal transduction histidine kinase